MSNRKNIYKIVITISLFLLICLEAFMPGTACSSKVSASEEPEYISKLFDKNKVLEINIDIDKEDFENLKENAIKEEYYRCNITINGTKYNNVGIRAKGNSSLYQVVADDSTDRYSFKIKADEYIENQNIYGLSKFVLNNNLGDATNMKEYMSYDLLNRMGVPAPGFAYAYVKVNNKDWGLYLAVESLEEDFLKRNYGDDYGNLYKVETANMNGLDNMMQGQQGDSQMTSQDNDAEEKKEIDPRAIFEVLDKVNGNGGNLVYKDDKISSYPSIFDYTILNKTSKSDKKRLINIIKNLNEGVDLDESIDVDEVLRYFAANTFLVNLDSYAGNIKHNYYLYENNGIMQILPWDLNLSFGAFLKVMNQMGVDSDDNPAKETINFPIDKPVTDSMEGSPLISKLLEINEYKEKYHNYLQEIIDEYINNGYFYEQADKVDNLISDYISKDPTAFYTYDEYKKSVPNLKQYGTDRAKSIKDQLEGKQPSESTGDVSTTVDMEALGTQINTKEDIEKMKQMSEKIIDKMQQGVVKAGGVSVPVGLLVTAVCLLVMIVALILITKFRRKRNYCK